jgi:hypothetical protein
MSDEEYGSNLEEFGVDITTTDGDDGGGKDGA